MDYSECEYNPRNETYVIKVRSPLLRPGLEIETEVSGKYLKKTLNYLFQEVRKFNSEEKSGLESKASNKDKE